MSHYSVSKCAHTIHPLSCRDSAPNCSNKTKQNPCKRTGYLVLQLIIEQNLDITRACFLVLFVSTFNFRCQNSPLPDGSYPPKISDILGQLNYTLLPGFFFASSGTTKEVAKIRKSKAEVKRRTA